jgi:hypothetical protein
VIRPDKVPQRGINLIKTSKRTGTTCATDQRLDMAKDLATKALSYIDKSQDFQMQKEAYIHFANAIIPVFCAERLSRTNQETQDF